MAHNTGRTDLFRAHVSHSLYYKIQNTRPVIVTLSIQQFPGT